MRSRVASGRARSGPLISSRRGLSLGGRTTGAGAPASSRCRDRAQHIGLHQMVPTAGAAYLDDVHRELFPRLGQPQQFLRSTGGTRHGPQPVAVDPRYESQLLFPADRACDLAPAPVELRRTQQVRIRIADFGDVHPPRVDVGQQRLTPERIVHHLPLYSHATQSTCGPPPPALPRGTLRSASDIRDVGTARRLYRRDIVWNCIHRLDLETTVRG